MIKPGGVAKTDGVCRGEEPERRIRPDHPVLVEQGELAVHLEDPLDHEHHVGTPGVVLVEAKGGRVLQGPGQEALAELGHLLAVLENDGVLADQVDAADVAVQIDPQARPVEPRGDLLDVGGLAGAVVALDDDAPVVGEAGKDGQGGVRVEVIGLVQVGHMVARLAEGGHLHVAVQAEGLPHGHRDVGRARRHFGAHLGIV